jgi:hypothetical protein
VQPRPRYGTRDFDIEHVDIEHFDIEHFDIEHLNKDIDVKKPRQSEGPPRLLD